MKQLIAITLLLISRGVLAQDCLSIDYIEKEDSISFFFHNNTVDTLYLFSSYFDNDLLSAKYLHQIDKTHGDYIISFIPLNPYLSAYLSDRIIFGDSRIITSGQILFKFITLAPENQYELRLAISDKGVILI